jgi:hypothetical protein
MSKTVRKPVTFPGLIGLIAILPFGLRAVRAAPLAAPQGLQISVTPLQLKVALVRAGLSPEALTAAGVSTQSLSGIATAAKDILSSQPLAPFDSAVGEARAAHDARQRKIQSGLASQEEISGYAQLVQTLATVESNRAAAIAAVFNAATANLTTQQRALLTTIEGNKGWHLPTEFLTVNRTEAEWVELRDALTNERVCAKNGEAPNAACQTLLATKRANATVAASKAALDANLSSMSSTWESTTLEQ